VNTLDVYIDFKCPASYLAIAPTLSLATAHNIGVVWHPFKSIQQTIPTAKDEETKGETHRRVRAIQRRNVHLMYAQARDIPMAFTDSPGNTDLALAVLATLTSPIKFINAAFNAYWTDNADLNDRAVVSALLVGAGYDSEVPDEETLGSIIEDIQQLAMEAGVVTTPGYIIKDQFFLGREHLPWIEELATA
jgi:2-hydroxychromene-2-carboxylate isomerase